MNYSEEEYEYVIFEEVEFSRKILNYILLCLVVSIPLFFMVLIVGVIASHSPTLVSYIFYKGKDPMIIENWDDVIISYMMALFVSPLMAYEVRNVLHRY